MTHTEKKRLYFVGFVCIASALAFFMYQINQFAPVQRDGSHFLFMANNIANGQSPYWASFETKNPFVEYYWAAFFKFFKGDTHIVDLARIAEALYLLVTSIVLFMFAQRAIASNSDSDIPFEIEQHTALAALISLFCFFILYSWKVNDTGFNIALYQPLLEMLALLAGFRLLSAPSYLWACVVGGLCFLAWFTKQTSVISIGIPLLVLLFLQRERVFLLRYVGVAVAVSTILLALFFLNLKIQGTFDNYNRSTFEFKSLIFSLQNTDFAIGRFLSTLNRGLSLGDPQFNFASYLLIFFLLMPVIFALDVFRVLRKGGSAKVEDKFRWVVYAWFIGTMTQACMGLTFYPHYFLSAIVPGILSIVLFLNRSKPSSLIIGVLLVVTAAAYADYRDEDRTLIAMAERAPVYKSVKVLSAVIPEDATVFNWGAVSHYHVLNQKPSDFEQNMILPYVLIDVDDQKRKEMFAHVFRDKTPDFFIQFREDLPKFTPLRTFPLSLDLLNQWTGEEYKSLGTFQPPRGRYGLPVTLFVRENLFDEAIARIRGGS